MSSFDGEFNRMVRGRKGGDRNRSSLKWNWLNAKQLLEHWCSLAVSNGFILNPSELGYEPMTARTSALVVLPDQACAIILIKAAL